MQTYQVDVAIVGAGGAGLRAALAIASTKPQLKIALISKVYPMRSHTVAAEGGAAGVIRDDDSFDNHFYDTVSGGDWLCEQDVVDYFVHHCTEEMVQLEQWGCPWSRKENGQPNVRRFGGMKIERTWFAADKSGFHMLHTLFQTSLQYRQIKRFDEHFLVDLLVDEGQVGGVVVMNMMEGELVTIYAKSVILATGGAGRVYRYNTNGGIVTGDGMAIAYKHGVPLRDMEFVQYHPTGLPGSGILMTEGCRGEGGILLNSEGYRYLQDYNLGPETPIGEPKNKYMELGPRDRLSQAFWHEWQAGRTVKTPLGDAVYLDLRHLGEKKLKERLPFICELSKNYLGIDPVKSPIPVRPTVHYTMGGIETNIHCETRIKGLYAVGECSSVGLHGANRLGSNSLAEIVVFGRVAGDKAAQFAQQKAPKLPEKLASQVKDIENGLKSLINQKGTEKWNTIRDEMGTSMEEGAGIYRTEGAMKKTIDKISELKERIKRINISDKSSVFNTDLLYTLELSHSLEVADAMIWSAYLRTESRGAHQRLDEHCRERDDTHFLKHSLAYYQKEAPPRMDYSSVLITSLPPAKRVYGAESEKSTQTPLTTGVKHGE